MSGVIQSYTARFLFSKAPSQQPKNGISLFNKARKYFSTATDIENMDIAIVGGGPVGLALACGLSSSQVVKESTQIVLIEGGDLSRVRNWSATPDQFSNRVVSITNASRHFLKDIGVWTEVDETRTSPIEEMQVWDGISDSRITFSAPSSLSGSGNEMARLTENFNLQRALLRRLEKLPEISIVDKTKMASIDREDRGGNSWPIVSLADGRQLRARLLVGADGFNSPVRSYAGIKSFGWSYDAQAIVATLSHIPRVPSIYSGPNTTAYQRFLPTGPIAFLPLSPTSSSLVWSTKPPLATALLHFDHAVLANMINAAFRLPDISLQYLHNLILEAHGAGTPLTGPNILEEIKWRESAHGIDQQSAYCSSNLTGADVGVPPNDADLLPPLVTSVHTGTAASFPLRLNHVDAYIGEGHGSRTVLVGDAAHTVHPLAGQGLNLGLGDVQSLVQCIETTILQGGDIGSFTALQPYSRDRYFENHNVLAVTDKLHKLYSTRSSPVVWARSMGLEVINELDPVKEALMSSAGADNSVKTSRRALGWQAAATGVELTAGGLDLARSVLKGVVNSVWSTIGQTVNSGK